MTIIKQWSGFSGKMMQDFPPDFYPFDIPRIVEYQLADKHTGYNNLQYIGCRKQRSHRDSDLFEKFSAFLVVRNDGFIAKGKHQSYKKFSPQVPGTLLILNIHSLHHVIRDRRLPLKEQEYWIGISAGFNQVPSHDEVETLFRNFLLSVRKTPSPCGWGG